MDKKKRKLHKYRQRKFTAQFHFDILDHDDPILPDYKGFKWQGEILIIMNEIQTEKSSYMLKVAMLQYNILLYVMFFIFLFFFDTVFLNVIIY
jgi:hypothetical protein